MKPAPIRRLPLALALGVALGVAHPGRATAAPDFGGAAAAQYADPQLEYLDGFLAAKPKQTDNPARSLVDSHLHASSLQERPPLDFDALASEPLKAGEVWMAYAESLYAAGDYAQAQTALVAVPETYRAANPARHERLRLRLALRGKDPVVAMPVPPGDALVAFNEVLALMTAGSGPVALQRLSAMAGDRALPPATRDRAALWLAVLAAQAGDRNGALNRLGSIEGDSPLAADALLAILRHADGISPSFAAGVERHLQAQAPESAAMWETRDSLVRLLLAQGATFQAGERALNAVTLLQARLARVDAALAGLERRPPGELQAQIDRLPGARKQRVSELLQRRDRLQRIAATLGRWQPYMASYQQRLKFNSRLFSLEIRDALDAAQKEQGKGVRMADLFRTQLEGLVGTPPDSNTAYRLFFALSQWEFEAAYPDDWRPILDESAAPKDLNRRQRREQRQRKQDDATLLPQAFDHANRLLGKVNGMVSKLPGYIFGGLADDANDLTARNRQQVEQIRLLLPQIDEAIRAEFRADLLDHRQRAQRWLNRFAHHLVQARAVHRAGSEQAHFDLTRAIALRKGEPLAAALTAAATPSATTTRRKAPEIDALPLLAALKPIAEAGDSRAIRADALRLRAVLVVDLYEAQAIASPAEAIGHYTTLLRDYRELIDRADITYQLARAQDLGQQLEASLATLNGFLKDFPDDARRGEASFRVGENLFALAEYPRAKGMYEAVMRSADRRYADQAEYKLGWTLFKLGDYPSALPKFIAVIERASAAEAADDRQRRERARDAFRAVSLTVSYLDGAREIERFFARYGRRPYVADLYYNLARFYLDHDRIRDAVDTHLLLTRDFVNDPRAPALLAGLVRGARKEELARLSLELQEQFVDRFAISGAYWAQASAEVRQEVAGDMRGFLAELAEMYHADAQRSHSPESLARAIRYYEQFVATFPKDAQSARYQFQLAEARFERGELQQALDAYEHAAYQFGKHDKAAEAGYAALVTSQNLVDREREPAQRKLRLRDLVARSSRFAENFPGDTRVDAVLVKAGEDILMLGEPAEAARLGESLLARKPDEAVRRRAAIVVSHGYFESEAFDKAEGAYQRAIALGNHAPAVAHELSGRLAMSVYRQAEALRAAGDTTKAIEAFLRVARTVPGAEATPNAEIDAAALLLDAKQWPRAIDVLERFQKTYPTHRLAADVPTRLAYAYENDGQYLKAADMLEALSTRERDDALARQMLWRSAELRDKAERKDLAVATFERYIQRYPSPLEKATEVRQMLADIGTRGNDRTIRDRWLREIIDTHARAGSEETVRVRFLAAQASVTFGDGQSAEFDTLPLKLPLDKSLAAKRKAMEAALKWYEQAGRYGIAEVTTGATFKTAELYRRLARDLLASERPGGLNALETEQYGVLLEEEAFPFEDKATKLHEVNYQRIQSGIYDTWVRRSLESLRTLVPARYDRVEFADAYFAYEPPKPPAPPAAEGTAKAADAAAAAAAAGAPGQTADDGAVLGDNSPVGVGPSNDAAVESGPTPSAGKGQPQ